MLSFSFEVKTKWISRDERSYFKERTKATNDIREISVWNLRVLQFLRFFLCHSRLNQHQHVIFKTLHSDLECLCKCDWRKKRDLARLTIDWRKDIHQSKRTERQKANLENKKRLDKFDRKVFRGFRLCGHLALMILCPWQMDKDIATSKIPLDLH